MSADAQMEAEIQVMAASPSSPGSAYSTLPESATDDAADDNNADVGSRFEPSHHGSENEAGEYAEVAPDYSVWTPERLARFPGFQVHHDPHAERTWWWNYGFRMRDGGKIHWVCERCCTRDRRHIKAYTFVASTGKSIVKHLLEDHKVREPANAKGLRNTNGGSSFRFRPDFHVPTLTPPVSQQYPDMRNGTCQIPDLRSRDIENDNRRYTSAENSRDGMDMDGSREGKPVYVDRAMERQENEERADRIREVLEQEERNARKRKWSLAPGWQQHSISFLNAAPNGGQGGGYGERSVNKLQQAHQELQQKVKQMEKEIKEMEEIHQDVLQDIKDKHADEVRKMMERHVEEIRQERQRHAEEMKSQREVTHDLLQIMKKIQSIG